jgi:CRISPR-associated protein Csm3
MTIPLSQKRLLGKIHIQATLVVETGLHIGGGEGKLDIGGIDKLVVREPITGHPYLPGSSIKGKLRSILERFLNKPLNRDSGGVWRYESDDILDGYTEIKQRENQNDILVFYQGSQSCELSRLFGATGKDCWIKTTDANNYGLPPIEKTLPKKIKKTSNNRGNVDESGEEHVNVKGRNAPARLIVRDSHLQQDSIKKLEKIDTGLFMTERKFENGLDRITAAATPRQFERVPKGASFNLEIVYSVEVDNKNEVKTDLINIALALAMLEDDALGGHGSRGYGKVKFEEFVLEHHEYHLDKSSGSILKKSTSNPKLDIKNTNDLLDQLDTKNSQLQQLLQICEAQESVAVQQ